MSTPSEAEIQDQIRRVVNLWNETRQFGNVNSDNWKDLEDALVQALESSYGELVLQGIASARQKLSGILTADVAAMVLPLLGDYATFMDVPERTLAGIWDRLYQRFIDQTLRVSSRQFSFGTPAAGGSNVGNGTLTRYNLDENGFDFEHQTPDVKTLKCIADENIGGTKHEEVFEIRGGDRGRDEVVRAGSGLIGRIRAQSARDSKLSNPSFSELSGTITAPTDITNWTSSVSVSGTNFNFVTGTAGTDYYRDFLGDTTPYSLMVKATCTLTQKLSLRNTKLNPNRPYYLQVAWNRELGGATGTLLIRMGSKNNSVVAAAQTGWQLLTVGPFFPKQFNEADADIVLDWTRTAGNLHVDDVLFIEGQQFDGGWYFPVGGTTKWLKDDTFTCTDTAVESILQRAFAWVLGRYLPAAAASPSAASVAALAGAGAGNIDNGTHSWKVTFVPANSSQESGPSPISNQINVVDKTVNGKVDLTGIPTGPAGTVSRKVYRTVAGDAGSYKLVGTIADNVTTTYQDNVADGSLGAVAPTGVTWAEPTA